MNARESTNSRTDEVHAILKDLVAFDSRSSNATTPIMDHIASILESGGVRVRRSPAALSRENLIATIGPSPSGDDDRRGIIFCGHVDTVPPSEPEGDDGATPDTAPADVFALTNINDKLYGLGSCDMKGFIACAIKVMIDAAKEPPESTLSAPVHLLLTSDEEIGAVGAQHFADHYSEARRRGEIMPLPRAMVIGEPTSLNIIRMHKGHLKLRIIVSGRSAHTGLAHLGINAITHAIPLLASLEAFAAEFSTRMVREDQRPGTDDGPWTASMTIARVAAGSAFNKVPDQCIIDVGCRLLPGDDADAVIDAIRDRTTCVQSPASVELIVIGLNPPLLTRACAPIRTKLAEHIACTPSLAHIDVNDDRAVSFASDGGILQGPLDLDIALFGPGDMQHAHRFGEFVPVPELESCTSVLRRLAYDPPDVEST